MLVFLISITIGSLMSYYGTEMNSVENLEVQLNKILEEATVQIGQKEISLEALELLTKDNYLSLQYANDLHDFIIENDDLKLLDQGKMIQIRSKSHKHESITSPV